MDGTRWVFDKGRSHVGGVCHATITSKTLDQHETTHVTSLVLDGYTGDVIGGTQYTTKSGGKIEGWIVRILMDGKVIRSEASLAELKSYAERNPDKFDDMIASTKEQELKNEESGGALQSGGLQSGGLR